MADHPAARPEQSRGDAADHFADGLNVMYAA
jgi:hypothetical protein